MTTNQLRALCVAGLLALVGVVGCSDDTTASGDGGSTTTTSLSATGSSAPATAPGPTITTPPASSPLLETMAPLKLADGHTWNRYQIEIFESYVRAEQAALKAQMNPEDADLRALEATHHGDLLDIRKRALTTLRENGRAVGMPESLEIRPYRFDGADETAVLFFACYQAKAPVYDRRSRAVLGDESLESLKEVGMEKVGESWKLTVRVERDEWKGKPCDRALPLS